MTRIAAVEMTAQFAIDAYGTNVGSGGKVLKKVLGWGRTSGQR